MSSKAPVSRHAPSLALPRTSDPPSSTTHASALLRTWCPVVFLDSESKPGISSLELQKQAGISYETAWYLLGRTG